MPLYDFSGTDFKPIVHEVTVPEIVLGEGKTIPESIIYIKELTVGDSRTARRLGKKNNWDFEVISMLQAVVDENGVPEMPVTQATMNTIHKWPVVYFNQIYKLVLETQPELPTDDDLVESENL